MYSFVEFRIHKVYLHPEAREVAFVIRVVFSSFYHVQKRQVSFDVPEKEKFIRSLHQSGIIVDR